MRSRNYLLRAKKIKELAQVYYEQGRQDRSYKWVWRYHIYPQYYINYKTFLEYLKSDEVRTVDDDALRLF